MQKKKNLKLFYLAYFILGFVIPIFDPLYPYFSKNFNVGFDKIGLVFFGGSLTAIISMISAGRISDKFPLRKLFLWSFAISFTGFAVFSIFHNFIGLIITVIIVNIGLSIFWPATYAKIFHDYKENFSTMYVKLERFYYLATALGPLLIGLLLYLNLLPRYIFVFLLFLFILLFSIFYSGYKDKTLNIKPYYKLPYRSCTGRFEIDKEQNALLAIKQLIFGGIENHIAGKEKLAIGLSGGLDSSSLCCSLAGLYKDFPITAFTVINEFNEGESVLAEKIVKKTNARWVKVLCTSKQLFNELEEINFYQNIPIFNTSSFAQYKLMESAAQHGFTSLVDGQGSDEAETGG